MIRIFEIVAEWIGWIRIVVSPLLIGLISGIVVYYSFKNVTGLLTGITLALFGLIIGVIWATRVLKKQGTHRFLSRIMATPDLDEKEDELKRLKSELKEDFE